jgi:hypothetical protein
MGRIIDIIAIRSAFALSAAWALMMGFALSFDGEVDRLLKGPYFLFLGASFASLVMSWLREHRPVVAFSCLVNAIALLIGAGLIQAVRLALLLF